MQYYQSTNKQNEKHRIFISYYHKDDQNYRDKFEKDFGHLFINKSVQPGDIETDNSDEYIKRLIQEDYISDSSVILVLIGQKTNCRKHVDWEISAGLNKKVGGYSGLIGIVLPSVQLSQEGKIYNKDIPPRLLDNILSKFADLYIWDWVCQSDSRIKDAIQTAFDNRIDKKDKIDNSRKQFDYNLCS